MSKLIYGSGSCTISATNVVGLEIKYQGAIKITDKTSENYNIVANNKKIMIFPTGAVEPLNDLFEYTGDFKVNSTLASDISGKRVYLTIKKAMDYPELMTSKPEDMTEITVENMNAGYQHKGRVAQTTTDNKIIKNQRSSGELYLKDGSAYSGKYHIHLTGKAMTGGEHNQESQDLYTMRAEDGTLIATGQGSVPSSWATIQPGDEFSIEDFGYYSPLHLAPNTPSIIKPAYCINSPSGASICPAILDISANVAAVYRYGYCYDENGIIIPQPDAVMHETFELWCNLQEGYAWQGGSWTGDLLTLVPTATYMIGNPDNPELSISFKRNIKRKLKPQIRSGSGGGSKGRSGGGVSGGGGY
tara:strand:- start:2194 stop:3270 length:1077 start_codon:yes stop_codon:yes gene_type:complete